ncbi:hypothetical protein VTJ04DRAFT_1468 [Mycothermus thermophilus]|uniref:uncharacterized protein n=1 Tax=Humicola insolens TaxID=85995 RepID=UPI003741F788
MFRIRVESCRWKLVSLVEFVELVVVVAVYPWEMLDVWRQESAITEAAMAFSFGGGGAGAVTQGNDLEVIQTEGLGFLSIAGDAKVQLTSKWNPPPAPTASLLSIASKKGLVAAAGPDAVHLATTESVRKAFTADATGDSEVRPFTPQAKLPLPVRISQLAFTADEKYLVLSAETGGGLAVYDVQSVTQGNTKSTFELSTNGETLRALIPNPMPESAGLCAIVTDKGNLLMANLAERKLVSGPNGPVLRSQVSCAAWSTKGKQLVAGMADGTIYQMTPEGVEKAHIPKPPNLGDYHVATLSWLENHVFLAVYNATNGQDPTLFYLITRQQPPGGSPTFTFQKLTNPVEPFVMDKAPHHSVLRLKDFAPNLQDLLLVSSTAHESVGLLTRSKVPLASDKDASSITGVFTTTEFSDDSRRAQLPMSEDMTETFPIGGALDLSAKDKVYRPIPADEIEYSPGPLPALWLLNNEGVLAAWWIVYNESIRSGTTYHGMATSESQPTTFGSPAPAPSTSATFGSPAGPSFGFASPPAKSTFGSPSTTTPTPAFGGPSLLGAKPSPWSTGGASTTPAFGTPAFGAPSFPKPAAPAFGQPSAPGLGVKASPWATGSTSTATPAFGQTGFASAGTQKVFGSSAAPATGGFASFASKGGFAGLGSSNGPSIFASKPAAAPEVSMDTETAFPPPSAKTEKPAFGASPFVLGTTFKADKSSADDQKRPEESAKSPFSMGFSLSLDAAAKQPAASESKDEEMKSTTPPPPDEKPKSIFSPQSTTPTTTPAPQKFDFKSAATTGGLFGGSKPANAPSLFKPPEPSTASGGLFSKPVGTSVLTGKPVSTTPSLFSFKKDDDKAAAPKAPEPPLPPDTTSSKPSVKPEDAPLPPDFVPSASKKEAPVLSKAKTVPEPPLPPDPVAAKPKETKEVKTPVEEEAPLPPDFVPKQTSKPSAVLPEVPDSDKGLSEGEEEEEEVEGDEEEEQEEEGEEEGESGSEVASEGSGVDVAKEVGQTPGATPLSSFGGMGGSTFSTISRSEAEPSRPLFGEITKNAPSLFPKAAPIPPSPRSPSPIRGPQRPSILRPTEPARAFSAPGTAAHVPGRKPAPPPTTISFSKERPPVDPNVQAQRRLAEKKRAEEQLLVDPEDQGIQQILQSKIEPTLQIHEFFVAQTKLQTLNPGRDEVPGACETLWRDINRMIDILGLNSRSIQAFLLGHQQQAKQGGRTKEDLENPEDWVLSEAGELGAVLDEEMDRCARGRIQDVEAAREAIKGFSKDLAKLRAKEEDLRKAISSVIDPDQQLVAKSMPLSAEQAAQQTELRRSYATFSKLLTETEEALTLLKARIASAGGPSGKAAVPTVDAIIRTINKMTSMAEKRSGDIDPRRQRHFPRPAPATPARGTRSREGSPFVTPQRASALRSPMAGFSSSVSPDKASRLLLRESFASSVGSSASTVAPYAASPRKKLSMYSEEEKKALRAREAKRKATLGLLRESLARAGPNVSRLRDDE